jgi:hypothetical protein
MISNNQMKYFNFTPYSIPSYILYQEYINIVNTPLQELINLLKSEIKNKKDITWMNNPYLCINTHDDIYNGLNPKEKILFDTRCKNIIRDRAHLSEECCIKVINYEIPEDRYNYERKEEERKNNEERYLFEEDPEYYVEKEIVI